jgi:hypothetical protein
MSQTHPPDADNEQAAQTGEPPTGDPHGVNEYAVAALDADIAETVKQLLPRPSSVPSSAPPAQRLDDSPSKQFTLRMLIALTLVTSLAFALMRTVPASVFAATLGLLLALAALAGMTRSPFGTMLWWTLLGVYSTAVVVLLVTG